MLTREIVPPATVGRSSLAPRKVACTAAGLPTTKVAGPAISNVSVLPALTMREISGALPGRRISTQESCSTFNTSVFAPTAAAAAAGAPAAVVSGAGAAAGAEATLETGAPVCVSLPGGGGTEISGTDGVCTGVKSWPGLIRVVSTGPTSACTVSFSACEDSRLAGT